LHVIRVTGDGVAWWGSALSRDEVGQLRVLPGAGGEVTLLPVGDGQVEAIGPGQSDWKRVNLEPTLVTQSKWVGPIMLSWTTPKVVTSDAVVIDLPKTLRPNANHCFAHATGPRRVLQVCMDRAGAGVMSPVLAGTRLLTW
jgi:hypothetical protein